jgi:CheY-like chemotaxis protein
LAVRGNTSNSSDSIQKILVIEDEVFIRENLLELLEIEGFDAKGAENVIVGVRLDKEYQPDFILCNVIHPEIDGYVDLKALREDSATAEIPFRVLAVGKTLLVRVP